MVKLKEGGEKPIFPFNVQPRIPKQSPIPINLSETIQKESRIKMLCCMFQPSKPQFPREQVKELDGSLTVFCI